MADGLLGDFLRTRRGRLRPVDVGLPQHGQRRVPGLRREEVALLAGVSVDYYLRLEQGRGGQPSEQVLRSLARALQLDDADADYLLGLIAPQRAAPSPAATEQVPRTVRKLLDAIDLPAGVFGRSFDVLATNAAAQALDPELVPGRNRLRSLFLVESERALYGDSEATAARYVAMVRDAVRRNATDPAFVALVEELTTLSPLFRELWAQHDVAGDTDHFTLHHPVVGDLRLHLERFDIPGGGGQSLFIGHPADPAAAARLGRLLDT